MYSLLTLEHYRWHDFILKWNHEQILLKSSALTERSYLMRIYLYPLSIACGEAMEVGCQSAAEVG